MSQWKTGAVVQLKSGGPRMTVVRHTEGGDPVCSWFKGGEPATGVFPDDALVAAE